MISQITDQLSITDIQTARETDTTQFDRVVTVCQDSVEDNVGCAYDWFNLADGPHSVQAHGGRCDYDAFKEAADAVLAALEDGEVVLVHCHAGLSRAPSVSAAALAVYTDTDYHGVFGLVGKRRPLIHPDETLKNHVEQYIREH